MGVILGPLLCDRSKPELKHLTMKAPAILHRAGVKFALMTDHGVIPEQYLPVEAGLCVREGLPEMEALRAITINAAEVIGLADRIGSLAPGKDADLALFDGHPLETRTHTSLGARRRRGRLRAQLTKRQEGTWRHGSALEDALGGRYLRPRPGAGRVFAPGRRAAALGRSGHGQIRAGPGRGARAGRGRPDAQPFLYHPVSLRGEHAPSTTSTSTASPARTSSRPRASTSGLAARACVWWSGRRRSISTRAPACA